MNRYRQAGLSLIELMVALLLSTLLVLGLIEIFSASKSSYLMAQGLSRAQETSRFAIDSLQRDARMTGHFGCVSDQAHFYSGSGLFGELFLKNRSDYTSIPNELEPLKFNYSIRGYEANNTGPNGILNLTAQQPAGGVGEWTPALPDMIFGSLNPKPLRGSDVLVLRFLSPESSEVLKFNTGANAVIDVKSDQWLAVGGAEAPIDKPGLLAIADCRSVVLFHASKAETLADNVTRISVASGGLNQTEFDGSDTFTSGQARLYRAETFVYYVGIKAADQPGAGEPALFRARYTAQVGPPRLEVDTGRSEEMVEGVENMQLMYAQDIVTDPLLPPTGVINSLNTANAVLPNSGSQAGWQRVGGMRVGLLIRGTEGATASMREVAPRSLGTQLTLPNDGRYRAVYETNVALRNRLFGN